MNKLIYLGLFFFALHFIENWCDHATDGFTIASLSSEHSLDYPTLGSEEAARAILNQPFHYLGSGGQSFVFTSADGKYVLKFSTTIPNRGSFLKNTSSKKSKNSSGHSPVMHSFLKRFQTKAAWSSCI